MNCVVVGLGWLGLPLAQSLIEKGFSVAGSVRKRSVALPHGTVFVYDPTIVNAHEPVEFASADCVIFAFPPNRQTLDAYANECLAIARQCSDACSFLLLSSTSVYPDIPQCFTETNWQPEPDTDHVIAYCEMQLRERLKDRLTILRLAGLVGPNRYPVRMMSTSGKRYAGGEAVNLIHQDDAVGLATFCIEHNILGKTINACCQEHPTKGYYYTWMAGQLSIAPPDFAENDLSGKRIDAGYSRALGYVYRYTSPFDFPIER